MLMVLYCREPRGGPIARDVVHLPVYPWHLLNLAGDGANTLLPNADSHISAGSHVAPRRRRSRRRDRVWFGKPEVISQSRGVSDNSTTVYTSIDYGNLSSRCAIIGIVQQQ